MTKLTPKKSLGQNFLKDNAIVGKIVNAANISSEDVVIEIGPGKGVMTEQLAKNAKKVIAIELDDRLISVLQETFKDIPNVEIIHGDILQINLPELVTRHASNDKRYKVVANIPYYITAPIVRLLLETQYPASEIILMVQKEVAERIAAKPGEMSILAVAVQYYATPEYLFTVPKESFEPSPKVESAIIKIVSHVTRQTSKDEDVKKFFRIVRGGFSAKRKTLANNLSNSLHIKKPEVEKMLEDLGFSKNTRAQELSVEDWKKLQNSFTSF